MTIEPARYHQLDGVHPRARDEFRALDIHLRTAFAKGTTKTNFAVFETYRSPQRQDFLYKVRGVSKAQAFQSAHQYGLAVDFVPLVAGKWDWNSNHDWDFLDGAANLFGLRRTISWDRPHIEHPLWWEVKKLLTK